MIIRYADIKSRTVLDCIEELTSNTVLTEWIRLNNLKTSIIHHIAEHLIMKEKDWLSPEETVWAFSYSPECSKESEQKEPSNYHQLTVAELIEKLKQFPPDALVMTEGCDCIGDAGDVELCDNKNVLITRV